MAPNKNLFDFKCKVVKKKKQHLQQIQYMKKKKKMGIHTNYLVVILKQMHEDEMNLSNFIF